VLVGRKEHITGSWPYSTLLPPTEILRMIDGRSIRGFHHSAQHLKTGAPRSASAKCLMTVLLSFSWDEMDGTVTTNPLFEASYVSGCHESIAKQLEAGITVSCLICCHARHFNALCCFGITEHSDFSHPKPILPFPVQQKRSLLPNSQF
jgi:hypothetical protein